MFKYLLLAVSLVFVFQPSESVKLTAEYDHEDNVKFVDYKIKNTLRCNIENDDNKDCKIQWLRNDIPIEGSMTDKYEPRKNELHIYRTLEDDLTGTYTCVLVNQSNPSTYLMRKDFTLWGKPLPKVISQGTYIEGQKITLECNVLAKPPARLSWKIENIPLDQHPESFKNRVTVTVVGEKSTLVVESAEMTDRGNYSCSAENRLTELKNVTVEASAFVRVKDKLAALWPFIGICAEVIILCAIILVYERNRMKTELEESDTDISPEQ